MRTLNGYMHGVNLGGWLSQTADTSKAHYDNFITEEDIAYLDGLHLFSQEFLDRKSVV